MEKNELLDMEVLHSSIEVKHDCLEVSKLSKLLFK